MSKQSSWVYGARKILFDGPAAPLSLRSLRKSVLIYLTSTIVSGLVAFGVALYSRPKLYPGASDGLFVGGILLYAVFSWLYSLYLYWIFARFKHKIRLFQNTLDGRPVSSAKIQDYKSLGSYEVFFQYAFYLAEVVLSYALRIGEKVMLRRIAMVEIGAATLVAISGYVLQNEVLGYLSIIGLLGGTIVLTFAALSIEADTND
jgi:hypothetical protein